MKWIEMQIQNENFCASCLFTVDCYALMQCSVKKSTVCPICLKKFWLDFFIKIK